MSLGLHVLLFGNRGHRWPRFRHEVAQHQSITSNEHPDDGEDATRKTTQHAWARTLRGGATSHMGLGQYRLDKKRRSRYDILFSIQSEYAVLCKEPPDVL